MTRIPRRIRVWVVPVLAWVGVVGAWGGPPPPPPPDPFVGPTFSGGVLSLAEALRLALEHSPSVAQAREARTFSLGRYRAESGAFDTVARFESALELAASPLATGAIENEAGRRRLLRGVAESFQRVADEIQRQLDSGIFGPIPECVSQVVVIGTSVTEIHCPPASVFIDFGALIRGAEDAGLDQAAQAARDSLRRQMEVLLATSRFIAYVGREVLRQQGVVPTVEERDTLSYTLGLAKLYRNGTRFEPQLQLEAVRDTYRGKPLNPAYGGKGRLVAYNSRVGFTVDVPLGRGGGVVSAGALERSAEANARSALHTEAFTLQHTALATAVAYWNAVAARQRVAILEGSVARERTLLGMGQALVEADALARADLAFVQARVGATEASLAAATQAYLAARVELARTLGIACDTPDALPEVEEALPAELPDEAVDELRREVVTRAGMARRHDLRAASFSLKASELLTAAARADLRRQRNLLFTVWYGGLFEENRTMALDHWWSPMAHSLHSGFVGPSAQVALNFSVPFGNHLARGRFAESTALKRQAEVKRGNLEREIALRSEQKLAELERCRAEYRARQEGLAAARASLEATREAFASGEGTAVDLVLTEENLVAAELSLVDAALAVLTTVAELEFELGRTLPTRVEGERVVVERLSATSG